MFFYHYSDQRIEKKPAMHVKKLLHKLFSEAAKTIDKRLHRTVLTTAVALCEEKHLSISGLGRCLRSPAKVNTQLNVLIDYLVMPAYTNNASIIIVLCVSWY